jgi:hypothetical protein
MIIYKMGDLVNLNFLDEQAKKYRNSKNFVENEGKQIRKIVMDNTKKEMEEVQQAINNLNSKLEKIMKSDVVKQKEEAVLKHTKTMALSIDVATKTFFKIKKIINEKPNLTSEQKREYEKKVYEKMISKFLTTEEIEKFKSMINMSPIMIVGGEQKQYLL